MDTETSERIAKLENDLLNLAQQLVAVAQATVAHSVITRAAIEVAARNGGIPVSDVRDFALSMAKTMGAETTAAVQTILTELPDNMGRPQ